MFELSQEEQPLQDLLLPGDADGRFAGEHALSHKVAFIVHRLDLLRQHYDHDSPNNIDADEAEQLRALVQDTYRQYFATPESEYDDSYYDSMISVRPLERETYAIDKHLRAIWLREYYHPRTREATAQDFQRWLDGYIATYGELALSKLVRVESSFLNVYRPFRNPIFENKVTSDLRTSMQDVLLIPGCGSQLVRIVEGPGTTVGRALPEVFDHHDIYSVRAPRLLGHVSVPEEIVRLAPERYAANEQLALPEAL